MAVAVIEPLLLEATAVEGGAAAESSGTPALLAGLNSSRSEAKNNKSTASPKEFTEDQENSAMGRTAQFQIGAKG